MHFYIHYYIHFMYNIHIYIIYIPLVISLVKIYTKTQHNVYFLLLNSFLFQIAFKSQKWKSENPQNIGRYHRSRDSINKSSLFNAHVLKVNSVYRLLIIEIKLATALNTAFCELVMIICI
jgi:hypothetical protein